MKNKIIAIVVFSMVFLPILTHAQTIQLSQDQIRQLLISLMQQVVALEQQLLSLQEKDTAAATSTVTIQTTASPQQIIIMQNQTSEPTSTVIPYETPVFKEASPIKPSCTLTGKVIPSTDRNSSDVGDLTWTTQGIASGTTGYIRQSFGPSINGVQTDFDRGYGPKGWSGNGTMVNVDDGEAFFYKNSNQGSPRGAWRLDFNGTYCYTTL